MDPDGREQSYLYDILGINEEQREALKLLGPIGILRARAIVDERLEAAQKYAHERRLGPPVDNEADAYRHFTWNVKNVEVFGVEKAKTIADNHEKYSAEGFGGSRRSLMDLWNNSVGRQLAALFPGVSEESLWEAAVNAGVVVLTPDDPRLDEWSSSSEWQGEVSMTEEQKRAVEKHLEQSGGGGDESCE
ncbi:DUF6973 domain-containing protein [Spirochaeta thermophila]|uniref:DUF6973 domain-containing protein n=1 Tax=Winmispira thermophila TaxID=154 RepID=UPI0011D159FE|nr:wnt family protein [Spirochaeta thermophila]